MCTCSATLTCAAVAAHGTGQALCQTQTSYQVQATACSSIAELICHATLTCVAVAAHGRGQALCGEKGNPTACSGPSPLHQSCNSHTHTSIRHAESLPKRAGLACKKGKNVPACSGPAPLHQSCNNHTHTYTPIRCAKSVLKRAGLLCGKGKTSQPVQVPAYISPATVTPILIHKLHKSLCHGHRCQKYHRSLLY